MDMGTVKVGEPLMFNLATASVWGILLTEHLSQKSNLTKDTYYW